MSCEVGSTLLEFWNCWARDGCAVVSLHSLLPRFVCCLGCLLQGQGGCGVLRGERLFGQETSGCCASDDVENPRFGCYEGSPGVLGGQHPLTFCNQLVAGAECALFRTVLGKPWEESFERPSTNFIKDCGSLSFMQNGVTMHSEEVVDSADAQALTEEG